MAANPNGTPATLCLVLRDLFKVWYSSKLNANCWFLTVAVAVDTLSSLLSNDTEDVHKDLLGA